MILDKKVSYQDRIKNRKELKSRGFISTNELVSNKFQSKYGIVIISDIRRIANKTNDILAIRVNISDIITYWYDIKDIIKYLSN